MTGKLEATDRAASFVPHRYQEQLVDLGDMGAAVSLRVPAIPVPRGGYQVVRRSA